MEMRGCREWKKQQRVWMWGWGRGRAPAPDPPKACEVPQEVAGHRSVAASFAASPMLRGQVAQREGVGGGHSALKHCGTEVRVAKRRSHRGLLP